MSLMNTPAAKAPVLVIAVGNPSRGDDAFGPTLAQMLQAWLDTQPEAVRHQLELITDQQLMVEHTMDLQGRWQVLFVDAAVQADELVSLRPVLPLPTRDTGHLASTHQCTPAQLLALYASLLRVSPPPAHLLTLRGASFELGAALSEHTRAQLPLAWAQCQRWLATALQGEGAALA